MESRFLNPDYCRVDLAQLLRAVQAQEKQKLNLVCFFTFFAMSFGNFALEEKGLIDEGNLRHPLSCSFAVKVIGFRRRSFA